MASPGLDSAPLYKGEAMLLGWGDSATRGMTVTFQLHHADGDVNPFKGLGTGKHGQVFQLVAVPITDEGKPVTEKKGGELSQRIGRICNDKRFQEWLRVLNVAEAAEEVRLICQVTSRKAIEPGTAAAKKWWEMEARFLDETGQRAEQYR